MCGKIPKCKGFGNEDDKSKKIKIKREPPRHTRHSQRKRR